MSEEKKEEKKKKDCDVCCSTKSRFVKCIYCSKESCLDCCEKFILDHINPRCMYCSKVWNYEFLENNMKKVFMKGKYKLHRENIIFEREKALFPDTQREIEYIIHNEKIANEVSKKREQISILKREISSLLSKHINYFNLKVKPEKVTINYPCPKSACRGFLKEDFTCGLCNLKLCKNCREEIKVDTDEQKYPEHVCDPSIVESIKAIQKETKPCPKCGTSISKIHGCDQMWCTICQTAFSWKTGEIDTGNVHNPHYWEFLQKRNKDVDEINRIIDGRRDRRCIDLYELSRNRAIVENNFTRGMCRLLIHLERNDILSYRNQNMAERNKDLRVEYLRNIIDEDKMKNVLRARDKKFTFNEEMTQILTAYYEIVKDSFLSFYIRIVENNISYLDTKTTFFKDNVSNIVNDTIQISEYSKTSIKNLTKRYEYRSRIFVLNTIQEIEKLCRTQLEAILKS